MKDNIYKTEKFETRLKYYQNMFNEMMREVHDINLTNDEGFYGFWESLYFTYLIHFLEQPNDYKPLLVEEGIIKIDEKTKRDKFEEYIKLREDNQKLTDKNNLLMKSIGKCIKERTDMESEIKSLKRIIEGLRR